MPLRAAAAGVDTWAPSWRVGVDTPLWRAIDEKATVPSAAGGRLCPEPIGRQRLFFFPVSGLVKAEGHPCPAGLAPVPTLPRALDELRVELAGAGVELPAAERRFRRHRESVGFAGLRRLDLTVDLRADHVHEGREVLAAAEAAARMSPHHAPTY